MCGMERPKPAQKILGKDETIQQCCQAASDALPALKFCFTPLPNSKQQEIAFVITEACSSGKLKILSANRDAL